MPAASIQMALLLIYESGHHDLRLGRKLSESEFQFAGAYIGITSYDIRFVFKKMVYRGPGIDGKPLATIIHGEDNLGRQLIADLRCTGNGQGVHATHGNHQYVHSANLLNLLKGEFVAQGAQVANANVVNRIACDDIVTGVGIKSALGSSVLRLLFPAPSWTAFYPYEAFFSRGRWYCSPYCPSQPRNSGRSHLLFTLKGIAIVLKEVSVLLSPYSITAVKTDECPGQQLRHSFSPFRFRSAHHSPS